MFITKNLPPQTLPCVCHTPGMHLITTVKMMSGRLLNQGNSLLYLVPFIENRQHFCYCAALGKSKELNPEEVNFQGEERRKRAAESTPGENKGQKHAGKKQT